MFVPSPFRSWAVISLTAVALLGASYDRSQEPLPAGTRMRFHLLSPASSNRSKTGDRFAFALLDPIAIDGRVIADRGAIGNGTILLAGHAGTSGHEGDLTLRLDSLRTTSNNDVLFADQRLTIDGRNRKILSGVLGIVPFAGIGSRFIRGSDIEIYPKSPIETILTHVAPISSVPEASADPFSTDPNAT